MFRPTSVNIAGKIFPIFYFEDNGEVNLDRDKILDGQIRGYDPPQIRIFDNGLIGEVHVLAVLLEEVLHGITDALELRCFDSDRGHDELGALTRTLADIFFRNGWWKEEQECACEMAPKIITIIPEMSTPVDNGVDIPIGKAVY